MHKPIALTDTIAKVLSSCVAKAIIEQMEKPGLLPNTHFRGRPQRATMDALQLMVSFIKDQWRKGNVVLTLFLYVKVVFPSIDVSRLLNNLRERGIPQEYVK